VQQQPQKSIGIIALILTGCLARWDDQDLDKDGYTLLEGDCWDKVDGPSGSDITGIAIHPGATEIWYDGADQDCKGNDDFDADADGWVPDEFVGLETITLAESGALPGGDCWDNPLDPSDGFVVVAGLAQPSADAVFPGAFDTWYDGIDQDCGTDDDFDVDGDGYRSEHHADQDGITGADCNDGAGAPYGDDENPGKIDASDIHPDASEVWYDGTDQDCDDWSDFDADGDGFDTESADGDDCDDTNAAVFPSGLVETPYNGIDDNCDESDGDGDADLDGFWADEYTDLVEAAGAIPLDIPEGAEGDCWDNPDETPAEMETLNFDALTADQVYPDAEDRWYDGVDQDCAEDGSNDFDADGDGYDSWAWPNSDGDLGTDCVDGGGSAMGDAPNPAAIDADAIYPGADETWYDGTDQDCDGLSDDDADGDGFDADAMGGTDCDDGDTGINPDANEDCTTAADDNCDGSTNNEDSAHCTDYHLDADEDGYGQDDWSRCLCEGEAPYTATESGDCLDSSSMPGVAAEDVNPGGIEQCTTVGIDDDCDGGADDDDPEGPIDPATWYADSDGDGYRDAEAITEACNAPDGSLGEDDTGDWDCDDSDDTIYPNAEETWYDGIDKNCDEASDFDADSDGWDIGNSEDTGLYDCADSDPEVSPDASGDDANSQDDDCDGYVDEDSVSAGAIVITEIMQAPSGSSPEWVEIYNAGSTTLYLDGWEFRTEDTEAFFCFSVDASVVIEPGELALLCEFDDSVGGYPCAYTWTDNEWDDFDGSCPAEAASMVFADEQDTLTISLDTLLIDSVAYDATAEFPVAEGVSMEVMQEYWSSEDNDEGSHWCNQSNEESDTGSTDTGDTSDESSDTGAPGAGGISSSDTGDTGSSHKGDTGSAGTGDTGSSAPDTGLYGSPGAPPSCP